jgi:exosortase/archaeosortase family protein
MVLVNKTKKVVSYLEPYKGVIYFLLLLFSFWGVWKLIIDGDMDDLDIDYVKHPIGIVYLFGKDVTPDWFYSVCGWLTSSVEWFIRLFPGTESLTVENYLLYFPDGKINIRIVWGCTGIKQMSIFAGIMACYFGPWRKKIWYIPMGCLILTIYNVVRIAAITIQTNGHPEKFDSLHDGILRYIYYTIIFLLWLCWEELIVIKKYKNHDSQSKSSASA